MSFEVLAEGLQFPEGPIAMPDGSVILVEIARGTLSRVWNGKVEVVCDLGGGPNGAALGPDGAVYVTNNGGGGISGGAWSGWNRVVNGTAAKGSFPSAVSRDPDKLDVFIVGTDNGIWTAAWDKTGDWQGWWPVPN